MTKTTQTILPDPDSLKEHIKRANLQTYYWRHYLEHNITKVDSCRTGWLRDETNQLKPFQYKCRQLPTSMKGKRKSQTKRKEVDLVKQSKAIDERSEQLSAVVAKIQMEDILSDEEELEESDNNDTDFASESDSFLLKTSCSNGLYIFDEYICKPLSFKFCFSQFPLCRGMTFLFYFIMIQLQLHGKDKQKVRNKYNAQFLIVMMSLHLL